MVLVSIHGQGMTELSGKIIESGGQPVIGANIYFKGTTTGTVSDLSGNFNIKTRLLGEQTLVISSVGFITIERKLDLRGTAVDLGTFQISSDAVGLEEVVVFASVAVDRKTPVPVLATASSHVRRGRRSRSSSGTFRPIRNSFSFFSR